MHLSDAFPAWRVPWLVVLFAIPAGPRAATAACPCAGDFPLRALSATRLEIPLAWDPVAGATHYIIERSATCDFSAATAYPTSAAVTAYGDTGKAPDNKLRFWPPSASSPSTLAAGVVYNYRVRARRADDSELLSTCVEAQLATEPVRGVAGDLWADVVLGQPDFTQNEFAATTDADTQLAGGVLIDRSHTPNRMFVADSNRNRVLGFDHVGRCLGLGPGAAHDKSYVKSVEPDAESPDANGLEFTDGHEVGATWIDSGSFGYFHPEDGGLTVDIDIDLGAPTSLNLASLNSGGTNPNYVAERFELWSSADTVQWAPVGTFDNPQRSLRLTVQFPVATARYVRFRLHALTSCVDCDRLFLGEGRIGYTTTYGHFCSTDRECDGDAVCLPDPGLRPQMVLGQPDFVDHAACNGDGTGQSFPARAAASATSLCLINPFQVSIAETIFAGMMAMDGAGALYVSDLFNNRILKYDDPFATDAVADDVWGQADFSGNECNRGTGQPAADRLCMATYDAPHGGIAFDGAGNLWLADVENTRVVRFPRVGGSIAHTADVVLGQPAFDTRGQGSALNQMSRPLDVAVDTVTGRVYVADAVYAPGSRILEFRPPFTSGMSASRALDVPIFCDRDFPGHHPTSLRMDPKIHGIWVENNCGFDDLFDLDTSPPTLRIRLQSANVDGIDLNAEGDVFLVGRWAGMSEYKRADIDTDYAINTSQVHSLFSGGSVTSRDAMNFGLGMAVLGNQLIGSDGHRMLIWNDPETLRSGQPADDVYGQPDFETLDLTYRYAYPQAYGGQLWVDRRWSNGFQEVLVFDPPLTAASVPQRGIPLLFHREDPGPVGLYPVLGCPRQAYCRCAGVGCNGAGMGASWADQVDFVPAAAGDELWVADRSNSRVFRIANVLGQRIPERGAFVDLVLGQANLSGTACNRGGGTPHANTLCWPYDIGMDATGNLYVADNGGENGSNHRMLIFDAADLLVPPNATKARFGIFPRTVLGTGGDYDAYGTSVTDPLISPFKPGFDAHGALVIGNNPYATQRFGVVYLNPLQEQVPQLSLGDFLSYPAGGMLFDERGDLYVHDSNWSRILIYRQPLSAIAPPPPPTPIAPCASGVPIENARLTILRNRDPAGDEMLSMSGRLQVAALDLDPTTHGFSFAMFSGDGSPLIERNVPPGVPPTPHYPGWQRNRAGTQWIFSDLLGVTPGGITRVIIRRTTTGSVSFSLNAAMRNFQIPEGALPVQVDVVLGQAAQRLAGDCAAITFGPPDDAPPRCLLHNAGDVLRCR